MKKKIALVAMAAFAVCAQAADWSDTSISLRRGNNFQEPYKERDITKNIIGFTHVSGYKYGSNFFNIDILQSDSKDPAKTGSTAGAQEFYGVYRNTVDLEKATGKSFKTTGVRGLGVTVGFDMNAKADSYYNSKKEMFVVGPTVMLDVPAGFLNVSLLQLSESNAPASISTRYHYDNHQMLTAAWGIPFSVASVPLSFEGFANYIGTKGKLEDGTTDSKAETNIDMQVMYDMSTAVGAQAKTFKVGVEYQYWKNKFGNNGSTIAGATAKTPMIRAEYHF